MGYGCGSFSAVFVVEYKYSHSHRWRQSPTVHSFLRLIFQSHLRVLWNRCSPYIIAAKFGVHTFLIVVMYSISKQLQLRKKNPVHSYWTCKGADASVYGCCSWDWNGDKLTMVRQVCLSVMRSNVGLCVWVCVCLSRCLSHWWHKQNTIAADTQRTDANNQCFYTTL